MALSETQKLSKFVLDKTIQTSKECLKIAMNVVRTHPDQYSHRLHESYMEVEKLEKLTRSNLHQLLGVKTLKTSGVPDQINWGANYDVIEIADLDDSIDQVQHLLALMVNALLEIKYLSARARGCTTGYRHNGDEVNQTRDDFYRHQHLLKKKGIIND